jgi:peptide/nickel transport system permease protein
MVSYLIKRLLWAIPVLFGVSIVVFVAMRLAPGDPAQLLLGPYATEETLKQMRSEMGLDQPIFVQYFHFLSQLLQGDFGRSITYKQEVLSLVMTKMGASLLLGLASLIIAVPLGLCLGILSAVKQNTWIDKVCMILPLTGISLPIFWLGLLLILFFSQTLSLFPATGMYSASGGGSFGDLLKHIFLPAFTLALVPASVIARMTRSSMLEVIRQDYIRTARAKGCSPWQVVMIHTFRNALVPVVTVLGIQVGYVIGGAVVVETIFSWPGVGQMLLQAVLTRDFTLVVGGTIILSTIFVFSNLIVDMLYGIIDPKIELE